MNAHAKRLDRRTMLAGLVGVVALAFVLSLPVGSAAAHTQCRGRYHNLAQPAYDRLVIVYERKHLTCSEATRVGNAVGNAYDQGLPVANYPPPPRGVPGGLSHAFQVRNAVGTFTCMMTSRGSDFVNARCGSGARFVRFSSRNSWFLHSAAASSMSTPATAASLVRRATLSGARVVIYQAGYKPRRFFPDNRTTANGFHWSVWNSRRAVGTGVTKTCAPGGVPCTSVTQSITYTRPRHLCGRSTFTRFHYSKWATGGQLQAITPGSSVCIWYGS